MKNYQYLLRHGINPLQINAYIKNLGYPDPNTKSRYTYTIYNAYTDRIITKVPGLHEYMDPKYFIPKWLNQKYQNNYYLKKEK